MKFLNRGIGLAFGALALGMAGGAGAQENLDQGKSGAQLFASDCAICHKTTAGLSKGRVLGLDGFLREHYTASRESAAAIAAYVQATDKGAPAPGPAKPTKKGAGKSDAKGDDKSKGSEKKSDGGKPADGKSGDSKPADAKPAEVKPSEAKPSEAKPSEPKPSQAKPNENKPSDGQPPDIYKPEKKSD
jgi:hypothetical protein